MKLLIVEDSPRLGTALCKGLKAEGFVADLASTAEDAVLLLVAGEYDTILLDLMLPGMSGLEFLKQIRGPMGSRVPVLVMSARSEVPHRIEGLDLGADDYLPKPFDFGELLSRIRSLCRRGVSTRAPVIQVGALTVDTAACTAFVDGVQLDLTASEYTVLEALLIRRGSVIPKEWFLDRMHDSEQFASENVIEAFVSSLRRKLREHGIQDLIVTRRGHGYMILDEPTLRP